MHRRSPRSTSPRKRGEDESRAARPGEGGAQDRAPPASASQDGAPPATAPHPVRSRGLDLSPLAGRGKSPGRGEERPDWVLLGEVGRAHGLRGEVRLKSFTAEPLAIARYGALSTDRGQSLVLSAVRSAAGAAPDILVARVEGVATREAAEALNRARLFVPRERIRPSEGEDEFLLADLIGLRVQDRAGAVLGSVVAVPNYGGGDLLEIAPATGGATALLPFTRAFVPVIDIAGGFLVVEAPEDLFAEAARDGA